MRPLEIDFGRWIEYEPPGLCRWETALIVAQVAGAAASVGGTILSAKGASDQAAYQQQVAARDAQVLRQKANEDAAAGQREAISRERQTELAQSRVQALAAASGGGATDPGIIDIMGNIEEQGNYTALSALYEGMARSRADTYQADINLFKSRRIADAAPYATAGTLLGGIGSFADRFGRKNGLLDLLRDKF